MKMFNQEDVKMKNLNDCDWYCNKCNEVLNEQLGFSVDCDTWICRNCEELNYVGRSEISDEFELSDFKNYRSD